MSYNDAPLNVRPLGVDVFEFAPPTPPTSTVSTVLFEKEIGDFTPFYVTITICTILGGLLFILNIIFGCCSSYKEYWQDGNTGNRWINSIWTKTPHKQPPLDTTELEECYVVTQQVYDTGHIPQEYLELQPHKRESDL